MGDFHEAPRLSNVVTLHVGDAEKEVELITSYQRSNVKSLVDKLARLTGEEDIAIYRGIITDYGLQRFKELPRNKYQEVKANLESRIDRAGLPPFTPPSLPPDFHPAPLSRHTYTQLPCLACSEKSISFKRLQLNARIQLGVLIACLMLCGWLLFKAQAAPDVHEASPSQDVKCYIAGKSFSIGYIERSRGKSMECVGPIGDMPAMWLDANRGH